MKRAEIKGDGTRSKWTRASAVAHLFVAELARLAVDEADLVEVGGQRHQAHLAEAKVGQLDVAQRRDEQVVRLQVAVDDAVAVQVLDGQHRLAEVETRHVRRERPHVLKKKERKEANQPNQPTNPFDRPTRRHSRG